jgi:O-antigen ligase
MSVAPLNPTSRPTNLVDLVKSASAEGGKRAKPLGFQLDKAGAVELALAPVMGLYLSYAVARLPEVFEAFDVPRLPLILMLVFVAVLGMAVPSDAWRIVWDRSKPMRLVAILLGLAFATIPLGIWPKWSIDFIRTRYIVSLVVFVCCLVLLRDRRALRVAMTIFILCVTAVAISTILKYDPNVTGLDRYGNASALAVERNRAVVGVSLDPNDFGAILAASFPIALWLSVGSFTRRVFFSACALVMCAAVVPTVSRGSMLAIGAAATALIGVGARGWRRVLTFIMVAGGAGVFVLLASGAQMGRFTSFGSDDYNLAASGGRLFFWKQGTVWMIKRPWGYGIDAFPTYMDIINGEGRAAHSTWVQYGMELGVAGLVTIVMLFTFLIRMLYRHRQRAIQLQGQFPQAQQEEALAAHMIAMLAAVIVADTFLSNAYSPLLYMALGLAATVLLGSPLPEPVATEPAASAPAAAPRQRGGRRVAPQWTRQA